MVLPLIGVQIVASFPGKDKVDSVLAALIVVLSPLHCSFAASWVFGYNAPAQGGLLVYPFLVR
jgi:hypothetical protein